MRDGKRYPGSPTLWKISHGHFIFSASKKSKNILAATWYAVFPNFCRGEAEGTSWEKTKQEERFEFSWREEWQVIKIALGIYRSSATVVTRQRGARDEAADGENFSVPHSQNFRLVRCNFFNRS